MTDSRWISSAGPLPVRDVEDPHVAADERGELPRAGVVRAQRPADAEQVRPQPERVAALDRARRLDPARPSGCPAAVVQRLEGRRLAGAVRLAGPQRDRAAVGDEQRVERVDEVRAVGLASSTWTVGPSAGEDVDEGVVLAPRDVEVDRVEEAVRRVVERRARTPARAA